MLKRKLVRAGFFGNGLLLTIVMFNKAGTTPAEILLRSVNDTAIRESAIPDSVFLNSNLNGDISTEAQEIGLNSHALKFTNDYIARSKNMLQKIKENSRPYFSIIDSVFCNYDLPLELKYLAVVESQLKSKAVSHVGAVGPWQLMPATARILKLKVTARYDERTHYYKSTKAAALYLRDLHNQFQDWLLVIAAYNAGPGAVYKAIRRSGSRNFWKLQYFLPTETRLHVKKFIATQYYFEGHGSETTSTKEEIAKFNIMKLAASAFVN